MLKAFLRTHIFVIGFFCCKVVPAKYPKSMLLLEVIQKVAQHTIKVNFSIDGICAHCAFPHTITHPIEQIYPRFQFGETPCII